MKYLVLGGNAAGMSFAAKMKRNDNTCEIIVIEKNDYVSFGGCGLPYYVGDYFKDSEEMIVRKPEEFIKQGIDLRIKEEVISVNSQRKEVTITNENGQYIESYDRLIISTGASPRLLSGVDVDYQKIFTLTSKKDGESLKEIVLNNKDKNFTIIGTGFIGMELMDSLLEQNMNVNIISQDKYLMEQLYDEKIVEDIEAELKDYQGLNLYLDEKIQEVKIDDKISLKLSSKEIKTDYLIMAIGFKPNSGFIGDVDKLNNGAIITNEKMETSIKNIYAIGDVATVNNSVINKPMYSPLATTANKSGKALADRLIGVKVPFNGMLGSSIMKIIDYELGRVGLTQKQLELEGIKYKSKIIEDKNQTSYYKGQEKVVAKIYYDESSLQILGIEIAGKKGVHSRLTAMSVVIDQKLTTTQLGYVDFPYAPPFSRTWDFLNVIGNVSK